jgi:ADP-ribosyl-[dinitrogen reductase] hydrolase
MLVEIAIGDAYGAAFEYAEPTAGRPNDLSDYSKHPRHKIAPGCYTDDTQMSLAVAEALIEYGAAATRSQFIEKFVLAYQRDPREGYASRFWEFLQSVKDAADFAARIQPQSEKSGAAMRACPIGVLPDVALVLQVAERQARITHDTGGGVCSAQAAALATHYFVYRLGCKAGLPRFLDAHVAGEWSRPHAGKVGAEGMTAVRAAITAIMTETSLSALLRRCVDFTGDVDTVAAVALGAASCSGEYSADLPQALVTGLEDGKWGADYLRIQDARLMALATPSGTMLPTGPERKL